MNGLALTLRGFSLACRGDVRGRAYVPRTLLRGTPPAAFLEARGRSLLATKITADKVHKRKTEKINEKRATNNVGVNMP